MTREFRDIGSMLTASKPDEPVYAIRPHELRHAAQNFTHHFPGDVVYTVSANPYPEFLHALRAGGIRHFAASNLPELKAIKEHLPTAEAHLLHSVKSATSIREAAHDYGVTHFAVDHADELAKIIVHAAPLKPTIVLRLSPPDGLACDPFGKFGCSAAEAAALMRAATAEGLGIGLSFHSGAQELDPHAYRRALDFTRDIVSATGMQPELIDIGGGFPAAYRNSRTPPLTEYCDAIRDGLAQIKLHRPARVMCKPGRALAASGASLVLKVELRRGNRLYLNDGVHGGLEELQSRGFEPPMRAWRVNGHACMLSSVLDEFSFCGPTGDGSDRLTGPFSLPGDIGMGDYIEVGQMGAYSMNRRSDFGGFLSATSVIVNDPAFLV